VWKSAWSQVQEKEEEMQVNIQSLQLEIKHCHRRKARKAGTTFCAYCDSAEAKIATLKTNKNRRLVVLAMKIEKIFIHANLPNAQSAFISEISKKIEGYNEIVGEAIKEADCQLPTKREVDEFIKLMVR
jgi:hypothetical protein